MTLFVQPKDPEVQLAFIYQGKDNLVDELEEHGIDYRGRIAHRIDNTDLSYGDVIIIQDFKVVDIVNLDSLNNDYHVYVTMKDFENEEETFVASSKDETVANFIEKLEDAFNEEFSELRERAKQARTYANKERKQFQEDPKGRSEEYKNRAKKEVKDNVNRLGQLLKDFSDRL